MKRHVYYIFKNTSSMDAFHPAEGEIMEENMD